jgi:hypothetical protein
MVYLLGRKYIMPDLGTSRAISSFEQLFSGEGDVFPTTRAIDDDFVPLPAFGLV